MVNPIITIFKIVGQTQNPNSKIQIQDRRAKTVLQVTLGANRQKIGGI